MNRELVEGWVEDLESGGFRQGKGALRQSGPETRYCCLGVLVDRAIREGVIDGRWESPETGWYDVVAMEDGERCGVNLPDRLVEMVGLVRGSGVLPGGMRWRFPGVTFISLSAANDDSAGPGFREIAGAIRRQILEEKGNG